MLRTPFFNALKFSRGLRRGQLAYNLTYQKWNIIGVALDQRYDTSPVIVRDNHPSAPYDGTKFWPHATPGHRAPQVWLPDRSALLDHLGEEFTYNLRLYN